jgi:hypothetical protein
MAKLWRCNIHVINIFYIFQNEELVNLSVDVLPNLFCNGHVPGLESTLENDYLKCLLIVFLSP